MKELNSALGDALAGFDNFEVLPKCNDRNTVYLHETLLIRKFQPSLNVKLHNKGGSIL